MAQVRKQSDRSERLDEHDITIQEHESKLRDLPPSTKLVAKVLEEEAMDQNAISERSLLPDRTVRYAIRRLKETDVITSRISLNDARKEMYYLQQPVESPESNQ